MSRSLPLLLLLLCCGIAPLPAAAGAPANLEQQRADFMAAEQALRQGAVARFHALAAGLQDYPLHPYLRFQYLRTRLGQAREPELAEFLAEHAGSPVAHRLHQAWIENLARRGQWETLLRNFPANADSTTLNCHRRQALYRTGRHEEALSGMEELWLVGRSQPRACDAVFNAWRERDGLDSELAWQRFRLAMQTGETSLARYLIRYMDDTHRDWAGLWLRVHQNPRLVTTRERPASSHPAHDEIVIHGIRRMARTDIDQALVAWDEAVERHASLSRDQHADVERSLAMTLAVRSHPQALQRLQAIDNSLTDSNLREWRVRTALSWEDWPAVLGAIRLLDEEQRESPTWRYWQARALEALEQHQLAEELYMALAIERGYYSFLAADRLALPYQLNHRPVSRADAGVVTPEEYPGLARARELFSLGRLVDARREWYFATRDMADWQLQSAATLARDWGWHDRAILAVARTEFRDDLELRFPLAFREQISAAARRHAIDPALAFALIRQESAFDATARSSAGALGLMQLMPATARQLAGQLRIPAPNQTQLIDIDTNLRLGMSYLGRMLDRYGSPPAALAAYNAGPHRVDVWLPRDRLVPADVWNETIPFRETRNYVQNVMLFSVIYEQRMDLQTTRLTQRMPVVIPRDALMTRNLPAVPTDEAITATGDEPNS